jgi:hypothetical protein
VVRRSRERPEPRTVAAALKPQSALSLVGTPQRRIDAVDSVTGRKTFAMDLNIPNALPTMLCRPPTINGSARAVRNLAQVKAMPGITDVAIIPHTNTVAGGVAVRGATFGQCVDAVDALDVDWGPGSVDRKSEADVLADSKALGKPVKLMWHRTDNFRQGRVHPIATSRVRVTYAANNVLAFDQRHTSVATDFSMGFGELLSAKRATLPAANSLGYSQAIFTLTQNVPYNFGAVTLVLVRRALEGRHHPRWLERRPG